VQPVAISADTPEETRNMCLKAGITFPVLSDAKLDTIRAYDLKIAEKGEGGREAGGPGEFLLDPSGTVRWRKLTEIRPPEIIKAVAALE